MVKRPSGLLIVVVTFGVAGLGWLWAVHQPNRTPGDGPSAKVGAKAIFDEQGKEARGEIRPEATPEPQLAVKGRARAEGPSGPPQELKALEPLPRNGQINEGRRPLPPTRMVELKVRGDGLAVAFGDVLLGRVYKEVTHDRVYYEPREPTLWPDARIPYLINADISQPEMIQEALRYFMQVTDVEFVPATSDDEDVVVFVADPDLCASYLGRVGGKQPVMVAARCTSQDVLHELMHVLGFIHEQSRRDRDSFVEVIWENIKPGYENQFDMAPETLAGIYSQYQFDFRYDTIMLYSSHAFPRASGLETLRSRTGQAISPVTSGLSRADVERVHRVYGR